MGKKYNSEEARQREAAHWFGAENGNKRCAPNTARDQRAFYRWCETQATAEELRAYYTDESKPAARRRFVQALMKCDRVQDFFDLTNQTHGKPREVLEVQSPEVAAAIRSEWQAAYGTCKSKK